MNAKLAACLLLACTSIAAADQPGRLVRIMPNPPEPGHYVTGDRVSAPHMMTILFLKEPCTLPIQGAENMRRAWNTGYRAPIGCWYPTGTLIGYTFVDGEGALHPAPGFSALAYPHAMLMPDGSATITEPAYDSRTYMRDVMDRLMRQGYPQTP